MNESCKRIFYVYLHKRKSDGRVFYIGKGKGYRAWHKSKYCRNFIWHRINNKHGHVVEIIAKNMHEECALSLESILIDYYLNKGYSLANLVNSRGGIPIKSYSDEYRINRSRLLGGKSVINSGGKTFKTVSLACEWLKSTGLKSVSPSHIHDACKGKLFSAYGFAWWYEGEDKKEYISRFSRQSISQMRKISCSNGMIFPSIKDSVEWLRKNGHVNASQPNITACCKGRSKTSYGYNWKYIDEGN